MLLKISMGKLQSILSLSKCMSPHVRDDFEEELEAVATLAEDVKEGHFVVFAVKGGVPKRFIVELSCLADPAFLCLLEKAKEEYGFMQKGPLSVPCWPEELQKILIRISTTKAIN
ncbi:hypothetical protein ACSBR2_035145 [Camellia fascicularis]